MNKIIDFDLLKEKIGVIDVAFSLGYTIDKRAGIGRYIELIGPDGLDKIIVKNTPLKKDQTFFRRNGNKGGDVINFVQQNADKFGINGNNWNEIINLLNQISNYNVDLIPQEKITPKRSNFDPSRFTIKTLAEYPIIYNLLVDRSISIDTIKLFENDICVLHDNKSHFNGYNLAFPYRDVETKEIKGYELRGSGGYKGKAAGTDSSNNAWVVDFNKTISPLQKRYIFFSESAFDIMSFVQVNKMKLDLDYCVFVSLGGTFSDNQVKKIIRHYSNAKAVDTFDNDLPGIIYGVRLQFLLNNIDFELEKHDTNIVVKINKNTKQIEEKNITPTKIAAIYGLKKQVEVWKTNKNYKDWNDFIMGKKIMETQSPKSKFDLHNNLKSKRMKL